MLIGQQPADEDRRRHGVDLHADAFALQVLRRPDLPAVDEDEAVAKDPRGKHRDRDERALPGDEARDVFGTGELRSVEFDSPRHAVEDVARPVVCQELEIDALDLHFAGGERDHAIIQAAGERERQSGHSSLP
ncbi:MAG: hypothetical protein HYU75_14550 [Betaproteobacteria bacterium]|nr:hypothetical protein [Betaproteobacteria bacterium]